MMPKNELFTSKQNPLPRIKKIEDNEGIYR